MRLHDAADLRQQMRICEVMQNGVTQHQIETGVSKRQAVGVPHKNFHACGGRAPCLRRRQTRIWSRRRLPGESYLASGRHPLTASRASAAQAST